MPNRIIKETVRTSEEINELNWFEECLFYRLITAADDNGRFDGRAAVIKGALFPLSEKVTKKAVEDAIAHLVNVGLLRYYEVNDKPYVLFPTWEKHQRVRNKRSKYPAPNDENDNSPQLAATRRNSPPESNPNPIQSESESESESELHRMGAMVREAVDAWNSLGLGQVAKIPSTTERYAMTKKRLTEYGLSGWMAAIDEIKQSDFLHGDNDRHWKPTFDWFVRPNNFPKVHDGNYRNKPKQENKQPFDYGSDDGYIGL